MLLFIVAVTRTRHLSHIRGNEEGMKGAGDLDSNKNCLKNWTKTKTKVPRQGVQVAGPQSEHSTLSFLTGNQHNIRVFFPLFHAKAFKGGRRNSKRSRLTTGTMVLYRRVFRDATLPWRGCTCMRVFLHGAFCAVKKNHMKGVFADA